MNFNLQISIIIPVYNGSNYLKEAIDSALEQTYENIEIIVVNDGSSDNGKTDAIAKSYGNKIRYFYKENGGVATALNFGIKKAKGEYISWLSHDDLYYSNKIEMQVKYLSREDDKNIIIFSNFNIKNYINDTAYTANLIDRFDYNVFQMLQLLFSSSIHACSMLIPKKCFTSIGFFSESLKTTQDYEYLFKLLKSNYVFRYIPEPLILTRHHEHQGTHLMIDCHLKELNDLYIWAFKLFADEFAAFSLKQLDAFLLLLKNRGILDAYVYLSELRDFKTNKHHIDNNEPIVWLYWENEVDKETPYIIKLCWETIINNNKKDFKVIITNPRNIFLYLPDLDKDCFLFEKIAHRADYIRFNLLYNYGGIWLDSDFVSCRSLRKVLDKIERYGFVYTGYLQDNGKMFPVIHFLGAKRDNVILKGLLDNCNKFIEEKLGKGVQPAWDEIGGYALQKLITEKNSFRYGPEYFSPISVHDQGQRKIFFHTKLKRRQSRKCFGQMLPYSVYKDFFDLMGEEILNVKSYITRLLKKNLSIKSRNRLIGKIFYYLSEIRRIGFRESFKRIRSILFSKIFSSIKI